MADYVNSKSNLGAVYPEHAVDAQQWERVETLLTPRQLRRRQLLGIPLVSFFPNPLTGIREEITDEDLFDIIGRSVSKIELETGLTIFPVQFNEKHQFDVEWWNSYGYTKVINRPVMSVEELAFTPASGSDLYVVHKDWIENSGFFKGQINVIPFTPAIAASFVSSTGVASNGYFFLAVFPGLRWIPALLRVKYTCGFPNGQVPKVLNEIIGISAAIETLGALQATNRALSYSLNIDGQGQSVSGPGPQQYQSRIEELKLEKKVLMDKLKNYYGLGITSSNL